MPDKDNFGAVLQPVGYRWQNDRDGLVEDGTAPACRASAGSSGFHEMNHPVVLARDNAAHAAVVNMGGDKGGASVATDGSCFTLSTNEPHAVSVVGTIDMQACKGNANVGDGSVSPTLCKPSGNDVHAVAIGTDLYNGAITGDVAATMGTPGSSVNASGPTVMQAHAFYSTDGTHGVNQQPEVSPAVKVGSGLGIPSPPAVAFTRCDNGQDAAVEVTPTMRCGSNYSAHPAVAQAMTVRRLTPRECERLQGFPDDYTLIPWRKKAAADCPDGPRYKALGNSMACNCMAWIGERIAAVEACNDR
jgi:hypothetical protein